MHIKQITICNFRSFKQQPEIQPFSPALNTIVGRNGSGKSNLFDAVQFVLLSPKFYTLRTEERQSLLHEGSGSAAVSAFVEIIFDNSDNRFNIESSSDEVVLRRTVGHKKDEFFLQRKRAQKSEIMSLLEGAGFSKSNPYFIVQQGKVNALCTMSDGERLELLKEVAGTTVYDEKKAESLAKMEANAQDVSKIEEILSYIEEKLEELQGEKEELTRYQALDRDRRAVEYTLYDKELRKARETLDDLEHARADTGENLTRLHEEARVTHDQIRSKEATMKQITNAARRNRLQITALDTKKKDKMTLKAKLDLECKEIEERLKSSIETAQNNKKELGKLQQLIQKTERLLRDTATPEYETAKQSFIKISREKDEAVKQIDALYAKQNRGRHYTTREERDAFLQQQIADLQTLLTDKQNALAKKQKLITTLQQKLDADESSLDSKSEQLSQKQQLQSQLSSTLEDSKRKRNSLAETRRDAWRNLDELHEKVTEARDQFRLIQSESRKVTPRATGLGLKALQRIVQQERLSNTQYLGTVMDNFAMNGDEYRTAVEVAAQNALHHVIVDTDATAAILMQRLERDKLGRVTFLPLNQLRADNVTYPESPDVASLLQKCISYHPRVDRAMKQVFGRKLLCRTVEIASQYSLQSGMDAITLQGDLCSRKGALTGGFIDQSKSKLGLYQELKTAEENLQRLEQEEREMQKKNQSLDQSIANVMGEMQRLEAKRANLNHVMQRTGDEMEALKERMTSRKKQMEDAKEMIPALEGECESLPKQIQALKEEMGTELSDELTDVERATLLNLKKVVKDLEAEVEEQRLTLEEKSVERQRLQSLLEDNLLKRKKELEDSERSFGDEDVLGLERSSRGVFVGESAIQNQKSELEQRRKELNEAEREMDDVEMKFEQCKKVDEEHRSDLLAAKNELEQLKNQDMTNRRALEDATEDSDRILNKRSMCVSKRELYTRKIQELGSLPPTSALSSYSSLSISALLRKLEQINKELKKYSHVNKKAFDQYVNFSEQRESLLGRKQELDQGAEKVKELVEKLDRQKDEAINRTFRGVSAHFKDVFKELVPNGAGELIMKTAIPDDESDEEDEEEEDGDDEEEDEEEEEEQTKKKSKTKKTKKKKPKSKKSKTKKRKKERTTTDYDPENPNVSLYRGIGIKVCFSPVGENYLMSQLSGGQKALVAMALIFAIQRCDPAPFYLFDELDQALDSTYRAAVAGLIQRQASNEENPMQFICSTFRPELVAVANRCYGISHQNKVSSIHLLTKKDALHFIANLMSEEEAVGEATSLATSRTSGRQSRSSSLTKKRKLRLEEEVEEEEEEEEEGEEEEVEQ